MIGLVDTAMLGHLDEIRFLAGVALASLLFDYIYWSLGFLRMATTGTTAQARGRGDTQEERLCLARGLALAIAFGLLVLFLSPRLERIGFALLSGEASVESAGQDYFGARILGAPAALGNMVIVGWFLGREQSARALWIVAAGNLANLGLDAWFILHLGWAARGAGLAAMAGQYLSFLVALCLVANAKGLRAVSWQQVLSGPAMLHLFRLNGNLFLRTLGLITAFFLFGNWSALLGTRVLAANALLLRILELAAYLIDGAAFATETLSGVLLGQSRRNGNASPSFGWLLRHSLVVGQVFALVFLVPTLLWPRSVFGLLTSHADVVDLAAAHAIYLVPVLLLGALAYMLDGFFLGLTAGATLRNSMLLSLVVFVPMAWFAVTRQSTDLLWLAMVALMLTRAITLGVRAWQVTSAPTLDVN